MAEEAPRGRNRRRYFRRKGGDKAQSAAAQPPPERPLAQPARDEGSALERRARPARRKRRGRNRRGGETRVDAVVAAAEGEIEYEPPTSVYIYTHIVRPASGAYEFRSEHFSKVGRTLDDYQIDIDSLFVAPDKEARQRHMEQVYAGWDFGEEETADAPPDVTLPAQPSDGAVDAGPE